MLKFVKTVFFAGFFVVAVVLAAGCGSSSGSVDCTFSNPIGATFDLNGDWTFTVTSLTSSDPECSSSETESETVTITVDGKNVTVTSADDPDFRLEGEVSASSVILGGSDTDEGETTTIECTIMPITDGGDTITFEAGFTFSGDISCDGTATGTITRN